MTSDNKATVKPLTGNYPLASAYFSTGPASFGIWLGTRFPRLIWVSHGINLVRTWWWTKGMTPVRRQMFFNQLMDECRRSVEEREREEWAREDQEHEEWRESVNADRAARGKKPL